MKKYILLVIVILLVSMGVYLVINSNNNDTSSNNNDSDNDIKEVGNMKINIIVDDKVFSATLYDNDTSRELIDILPLDINMNELNGNEKYYYMDKKFSTNSFSPKTINVGDIMLYQSNYLVLFYKTFDTSYSYTKIGKVDNPEGLEDALGDSDVNVKIELVKEG